MALVLPFMASISCARLAASIIVASSDSPNLSIASLGAFLVSNISIISLFVFRCVTLAFKASAPLRCTSLSGILNMPFEALQAVPDSFLVLCGSSL